MNKLLILKALLYEGMVLQLKKKHSLQNPKMGELLKKQLRDLQKKH